MNIRCKNIPHLSRDAYGSEQMEQIKFIVILKDCVIGKIEILHIP